MTCRLIRYCASDVPVGYRPDPCFTWPHPLSPLATRKDVQGDRLEKSFGTRRMTARNYDTQLRRALQPGTERRRIGLLLNLSVLEYNPMFIVDFVT